MGKERKKVFIIIAILFVILIATAVVIIIMINSNDTSNIPKRTVIVTERYTNTNIEGQIISEWTETRVIEVNDK